MAAIAPSPVPSDLDAFRAMITGSAGGFISQPVIQAPGPPPHTMTLDGRCLTLHFDRPVILAPLSTDND